MPKEMNLIPDELKLRRRNKQLKKKIIMASAVPGVFVLQIFLSIYTMGNEINELKESINIAKGLEQQITTEQNLINKNRFIITNLTNGGLPLNQFLLFTGVSIPEDIRLYYIGSKANSDGEKSAKENDGAEEVVEGTENSTPPVVEGEEEVVVESGEDSGAVEDAKVEGKEEEIIDNRIIIQGAALNVNSIGIFMGELEKKNDYIGNVDIVDVQNHYNGAFNYKIFEIVIEMRK